MATYEHQLNTPPLDPRAYELWLQHAAGFIIFEDARAYAMARIDPALNPEIREAVRKGIDEAVYGLMMIVDGVSGVLSSASDQVRLSVAVRHFRCKASGEQKLVSELDLANGDGMCMGFHGWCEDDYGATPVVVPPPHRKLHSRRLTVSPRSARASPKKASSKKASSKKASPKKASPKKASSKKASSKKASSKKASSKKASSKKASSKRLPRNGVLTTAKRRRPK